MKHENPHHKHSHPHSEPQHAHPSGGHAAHTGHDKHAGHTPEMFRDRFFVSLLLTLPILYFSEHFQDWFGYRAAQFPGSAWVNPVLGTILYFYGGLVFLKGALRELRARTPGMMTLIALGITAAYGYSLAVSLGLPGKPFYWELATLIDVMLLGHWLEMASVQAASRALEELSKLMPTTAHRILGDRIEDIPVSALKEGDLILIRPGEQVPADGVVVEGASTMNEAFLTGESRPVPKEPGDEVIAGAVNGEGALKVRVTRTGEATTLSQILRLVQEAQASRSRFQALADRVAGWLFYIALTLGTLTFLVWLALGRDFNFALSLAVTVVVIACPHALGLAIPLVTVNATALAAKNGILVRNREAFERGREIRFVALDKTGTLTEGRFAVRAVYAHETSEEEALSLAAALEALSEHPLAQAIVEAAEGKGLPRPEVRDFQAVPGKGVEGTLGGKRYRVGRPEWAEELGLKVSEPLKRGLKEAEARGESVVALMDEARVLALLALAHDGHKRACFRDLLDGQHAGKVEHPADARPVFENRIVESWLD